jgi:MFS transporter, OFA family, oxalate/formate antiporter
MTTGTSNPSARGEPLSWRAILVLVGCTGGVVLNVATLFNGTLTVFMKPIGSATGWSRGEISAGLSMAMLPLLLFLPLIGRFSDRIGPRRVVLVGAPLFSLALASLAWISTSYSVFLLVCALVGTAGVLTYNTLYYAIVANWFDRRLGLALGITAGGTGLGLMMAPIAAEALIVTFGWRNAYVILAITAFAVVFPIALLLQDHPTAPTEIRSVGDAGISGALRSPRFWRLALAYFLTGVAINGTVVHLIPLLTDRGMSGTAAAFMASYLGMGVLVARLGAGFLLDYVDAGLLGGICFLLAATGIGMLAFAVSGPLAIIAVLLVGVALGAEGDVLGYVTRRLFGATAYGTALSLMVTCFLLGVLLGPLAAGASFDLWRSYEPVLFGFVTLSVLASLLHMPVTRGFAHRSAAIDFSM